MPGQDARTDSKATATARLLYRRPGDRKLKNEGRLVWLREKSGEGKFMGDGGLLGSRNYDSP